MTWLDWVVVGFAVLFAIRGAQVGFVAGALALVGLVAGAVVGGRLANALLQSGSHSRYAPLLAIGGALLLVVLFESLGARIGVTLRGDLRRIPRLGSVDSAGGVVLGAAAALFLAWAFGVVALQLPGQSSLREAVQRSLVLRQLNSILPPRALINALARLDPFPALGGPFPDVPAPNPAVLQLPGVRGAAPSVVRVLGTACGLGIEGSGWVAAPQTVVTAAHVVAGEDDTVVNPYGTNTTRKAVVVAFDATNDVAVLRVPGLRAKALPLVTPQRGAAIAALGYPEDGPFNATPGRIGTTQFVLTQNAYGRGPVNRLVTSLRGNYRHGDSGGPGVDANGRVQTMVFASRVGGGGFGVPAIPIRAALAGARNEVSTGDCAP